MSDRLKDTIAELGEQVNDLRAENERLRAAVAQAASREEDRG